MGVILATVISRLLVSSWYDPYILYRDLFKVSAWKYYYRFTLYTLVMSCLSLLSYWIASHFDNTLVGLLLSLVVSVLISPILLAPFIKSQEFSQLKEYIKRLIPQLAK